MCKNLIEKAIKIFRKKTTHKETFTNTDIKIIDIVVRNNEWHKSKWNKNDEKKKNDTQTTYISNQNKKSLILASIFYKCEDWKRRSVYMLYDKLCITTNGVSV